MYRESLDRFFKENPAKENETPSAASIAHFQIKLLLAPDINRQIQDFVNGVVFKDQPSGRESALAEKYEMESATTCEQIIRFMRRPPDPMNQHILINRAMEFEDELIPEVIRMLKRSLNVGFIETTARVLSVCSKDVAEALIGYFDDVRNPYAQSMILVVLGFKADETHIPWLIEKYKELKRKYPSERYCDGAVYALVEIENRFYDCADQKR